MPVISLFRRDPPLTGAEIARFAEAACALTLAWAAIRLLPFRTVMRSTRIAVDPGSAPATPGRAVAGEVRQAIMRARRRLPWRIVCFPEGLAAHWMLRRRGLPSMLHYGLRPSAERLSAHVWVTLAGDVVIGEETADPHHCVATFPEARP